MDFASAIQACPLIAILRGITPDEVRDISDVLVEAGIRIIEVPLNSPDPLVSIERLVRRHGEFVLVGAGTVMTPEDVIDVRDAGGELIVSPHFASDVIDEAKSQKLYCVPGAATPTEGFNALASGADALKLFPAEAMPPKIVKAWRAVFPAGTRLLPVGGISEENMETYMAAGASGFGIGSSLYAPGRSASEVGNLATSLVSAVAGAHGNRCGH
ncbi:MAG: 2-dehydro-3-deoxy-6-phosphogalactonate aldolase [Hyphomicrobiaceae bacterium]